MQEIADLQEDIRHLEEDLHRKFLNLKLCHTRLESRTYRPNVELCRDQVGGYPSGALPPPLPLKSPQDHSLPSTYSWWSRGAQAHGLKTSMADSQSSPLLPGTVWPH